MPHLVIEYTDNLDPSADIPGLLSKANRVLAAAQNDTGPVFPLGGIRSRAIKLTQYCVADGSADDAFVHATLRIAQGRPAQVRKEIGHALFAMISEHFAALYHKRYLALSLEVAELGEDGTFKLNNIHARYTPR
jgi:5-carboxymethyl-2-hydroxymuconate isomerase